MFTNPTEPVTLTDMLDCREKRLQLQNQLLGAANSLSSAASASPGTTEATSFGAVASLISFCLNIPGPVKSSEEIKRSFAAGKESIYAGLAKASMETGEAIELHGKTGDELLLLVWAEPEAVKDLTVRIEEAHKWGRLFDIDVLDQNGNKLSRPSFRTCILCGRQAQDCARSRRHTVEELQERILLLLQE